MRKITLLLIFLIIIFVVNLVFYYLSTDYKFFLKKIKDPNNIVYLDDKIINDDEIIKNELINKENKKILNGAEVIKLSKKNEKIFDLKDNDTKVALKEEIVLGNNYKEIKDLFLLYNLNKLEINSNLFDITDEYPDNYFEYYSKDLVLYFFPTKTYDELFDIFSILDNELPFTLNELNNFGDNSFYINLNENIKDRFVRLVISNKGVVFGLKIKKTEYNLVKDKLNKLKTVSIED